jgi:hypothetical protein
MERAFKGIYFIAWAIMVASWFPLASIESKALSQPNHYSAPYTQPMKLKGVVRYVTPSQEWWDSAAHIGFGGGWIVGVLAFAVVWREKRKARKTVAL